MRWSVRAYVYKNMYTKQNTNIDNDIAKENANDIKYGSISRRCISVLLAFGRILKNKRIDAKTYFLLEFVARI